MAAKRTKRGPRAPRAAKPARSESKNRARTLSPLATTGLEQDFLDGMTKHAPSLPKPIAQGTKLVRPWQYHLAWRKLTAIRSRAWTPDFLWLEAQLIVEVQGGIHRAGGHSTGAGIERDCAKAVTAAAGGWLLLPFTRSMIHEPTGYWFHLLDATYRARSGFAPSARRLGV